MKYKLDFISLWRNIVYLIQTRPIYRGMLSAAIIWPTSNLINQTVAGKEQYNWKEVSRYFFYGCCYATPCLYCWIRLSGQIWPRSNLKTAFHKAMVEQFTYTPFAMSSFFFIMSMMEGKSFRASVDEVTSKFVDTFMTALMVWPTLQTINFCWISEKNRIPYISLCSLGWTIYLAYKKHVDTSKLEESVQVGLPITDPSKPIDCYPSIKVEKSFSSSLNTVDLSPYNKLINLTLKP